MKVYRYQNGKVDRYFYNDITVDSMAWVIQFQYSNPGAMNGSRFRPIFWVDDETADQFFKEAS